MSGKIAERIASLKYCLPMLGVKVVATIDVLVHKGGELPMLDSMCDVENQDYTCADKM